MTEPIGGTPFLAGAQGAAPPAPGEFRQAILGAAAQALGMSTQDVQSALQGGQSLADLAQQKGVSTDDLVSAVAAGLQQVGAGSDATQVAQRVVSHKGGHHHHGHHGGSGSDGGDASTSPFTTLASELGMSQDDLLAELAGGTSLGDLLGQKGLTQQDVESLLGQPNGSVLDATA